MELRSVDTLSDSPSWTARPYRPGDEVGATALFGEVFGRPLSVEHYHWKLLAQPAPFATVWLATAGERIVGQYAGTPIRFKLGGNEVTAVHCCDVMTASEFRRRGVLTAVGSAAHAAWVGGGAPFVTGLHYGGWGSRREFLGWRKMFTFVWVNRPLRFERLLARRVPVPGPAGAILRDAGLAWNRVIDIRLRPSSDDNVRISEMTEAGGQLDEVWARISPGYESLVIRDSRWLSYRYLDAPGFGYRLLLAECDGQPAGYAVYRLTTTAMLRGVRATGWIPDLFTAPKDAATRRALLRACITRLRAMGADEVRALVARGTPLHHEFRRAGFLLGRGTFDVSIVPLDPTAQLEGLHDPRRWFTMGGDFDVM